MGKYRGLGVVVVVVLLGNNENTIFYTFFLYSVLLRKTEYIAIVQERGKE